MEKIEIDKMFEIIARGGNARELAILATDLAKGGNFKEANKNLNEAKDDYELASVLMSEYLQSKLNEENQNVELLALHATEHLTSAKISINYVYEIVEIYKLIYNIQSNRQDC